LREGVLDLVLVRVLEEEAVRVRLRERVAVRDAEATRVPGLVREPGEDAVSLSEAGRVGDADSESGGVPDGDDGGVPDGDDGGVPDGDDDCVLDALPVSLGLGVGGPNRLAGRQGSATPLASSNVLGTAAWPFML
jgi:hypothetical protein